MRVKNKTIHRNVHFDAVLACLYNNNPMSKNTIVLKRSLQAVFHSLWKHVEFFHNIHEISH